MQNQNYGQENYEQPGQPGPFGQPGFQNTNQFYQPQYNNTQYQVPQQTYNQPQHYQPQPVDNNQYFGQNQQFQGYPQNYTPNQGLNGDDVSNRGIGPNNVFMQVDQEEKERLEREEKLNKKNIYNGQPQKKMSFRKSITSWGTPSSSGALKFCLGYLSMIVVLAIMIALMVYHFGKKDLELSSVSGGLDYIAFNLNSDPIIELIAGNPVCPVGYETIHLGRWPGTNRGCDCPISGLKSGYCRSKEDLICTDVSDIDEIDMFNFEGSTWCAKRAQLNVDYVKAATCSSDYQQCSPGICMRKSLSCPITYVTIESTGTDSSKRLTSGNYITVTREQGKSPLIDIDISLNSLPCFSMNEIPSGGGDYFLLKRRPDGCGTYGVDTLFSAKIAQTTEDQVFTFNNFPANVLNLPNYRKVFQITPTILAARERVAVASNQLCLAIDTNVIRDAGDAANSLDRYVSGTAITAMIIHGLLFFGMLFAFCKLKSQYSWSEMIRGKESGLWLFFYIPLALMDLIVFIVMTGLISSARDTMKKSTDYLVTLDKAGCFTSGPPQKVIGDYDDLVDQTVTKLHSYAIALLSITLISYVIIVGIIIYKKKCKN